MRDARDFAQFRFLNHVPVGAWRDRKLGYQQYLLRHFIFGDALRAMRDDGRRVVRGTSARNRERDRTRAARASLLRKKFGKRWRHDQDAVSLA